MLFLAMASSSFSALRLSRPRLLRCLVLGVGIYSVLIFAVQRQLLYPGQRWAAPFDDGSLPAGVEQLWLETSVGAVESWLILPPEQSPGSAGPAIVMAHGNAEFIDHWVSRGRLLAARGLVVLLVEFPGFGRSAGSPSEDSIAETMLLAWDALAARPDVDEQRIVGYGRSLGGGAACLLSRHRPLAALVLQSSFTSVRAFAAQYFMPAVAVLDPFDNVDALAAYDGPVLVLHGADDLLIPLEQGRLLAATSPRAEWVLQACRHNDCPPDWPAFVDGLEQFLRDAGVLDAGG